MSSPPESSPQQMGAVTHKLKQLAQQVEKDLEKVRNSHYTASTVADLTDDYQDQLDEILEDAQARYGEFTARHVDLTRTIINALSDMTSEVSLRNWSQNLVARLRDALQSAKGLSDYFSEN